MSTQHTVQIYCTNTGEHIDVPMGITLGQLAQEIGIKLTHSVVGAIVNNKYIGLTYRVFQPKRITFFDITHPEGMRTYVRSLIMSLFVAVKETMPGAELHVLRSVSRGLYCEVRRDGSKTISDAEIEDIKACMHALQHQQLPIERSEIETAEALKIIDTTSGTADLLEQHGEIYTTVHTLAGHSLALHGDLVPNTSIIDVFDLVPYFEGFLLRLPKTETPTEIAEAIPQEKMFSAFVEFDRWRELLSLRNVSTLNKGVMQGASRKIINVAEALHEKKVATVADMIAQRRDTVKVVLIAGPSSSGKTTFCKRLATQLVVNAMRPRMLSIDNYFVNREDTPRDENGDYDFEALEAVDVNFFNKQLVALTRGEEVELPKFDFTKGARYFDGERMKLLPGDVLIIEGTHGLSPQLTAMVPHEAKFKVYIAPLAGLNFDALTRISTTDNRLIRRIVRDYKYRGYSAEETIARWPSVRRGEEKYIYPFQEEADVVFNSALFFELAMLKVQAEPILLQVAPNSPCYAEARRLMKFLGYFKPIDSQTVPPTSLLREFVGGSSFEY